MLTNFISKMEIGLTSFVLQVGGKHRSKSTSYTNTFLNIYLTFFDHTLILPCNHPSYQFCAVILKRRLRTQQQFLLVILINRNAFLLTEMRINANLLWKSGINIDILTQLARIKPSPPGNRLRLQKTIYKNGVLSTDFSFRNEPNQPTCFDRPVCF